jgi:hypothetical protein
MKTTVWLSCWTACAASGVLSGCCTSSKSVGCGHSCATTQIVNPLPPNYENYTPPSAILSPIPSSPAAVAPAPADDVFPPPPAETQATPNIYDDFEFTNQKPQPDFR